MRSRWHVQRVRIGHVPNRCWPIRVGLGGSMRLNNTTLAALATVVCIATAATVLALDHVGIINLAPTVEYAREQPQLTVPAPVAAERPQTPVETLAEATPDVFDDEEVEPAEDEE